MPELKVPEFVDNRFQVLNINGHNPPETTILARDLKARNPKNDLAIIKYFPPEHKLKQGILEFLMAHVYLSDVDLSGALRIITAKQNWIAFEYLATQSLYKDVLFDRPFTAGEAMEVCKKIAVVCDTAAEYEIVHMALNPRNVFALKDGTVKIKDWLVEEKWLSLFGGLTEPYYFQAPEVIGLNPQGHASDIYSLGLLAAFLVSGEWEIKFKLSEVELPDSLSALLPYFLSEDPARRIGSWKEAVVAFDSGRFVPVMKVEPDDAAAVAEADGLAEEVGTQAEEKPGGEGSRWRRGLTPRAGETAAAEKERGVRGFKARINWRYVGICAAVVLAIAVIATAALVLPALLGSRDEAKVVGETEAASLPSLVGMAYEDAQARLEELGCESDCEEAFSDEVAAGLVISQDPGERAEISGSLSVLLVVSKGKEPAEEAAALPSGQASDAPGETEGTDQPQGEEQAAPAAAPQASQRPVASFSMSPSSGTSSGVFVSFDASSSYDPDGGSIASYSWSFGGSGARITREFTSAVAPADVAVTLTVTDDEGQTSSVTKYVHLY